MNRKSTFIILLLCGLVTSPAFAYEVFIYLGYENGGRVHRVLSLDELNSPVGYLFECAEAEGFAVDTLKNFRFINLKADGSFKPAAGYIFRQVFDGSAAEADSGKNGRQTSDERGKIADFLAARPVFRPVGSPYSAGCGKPAGESLALASFLGEEVDRITGKNWYQLPNGSWYQSWLNDGSPDKPSYRIIFDRWEERKISFIDSFWRGYVAGLAHEREAGSGYEKRLMRAEVDGAMELMDGKIGLSEIARYQGHAFMHVPAGVPAEGDLYVYTWNGAMPGRLYQNGKLSGARMHTESRDRNNRFLVYGYDNLGERRLYAFGTDILKQWLQIKGLETENADCSLAVSYHDPAEKITRVYAYSPGRRCVYEIKVNERIIAEVLSVRAVPVDFEPMSLYCDARGIVYATAVERRPETFNSKEQLVAGYEAMYIDGDDSEPEKSEEEIQKRARVKRDLHGRLVFARTHFAVLHCLFNNADTFVRNGEVYLDKDYQYCTFALANTSIEDLYGGINDILDLTGKPGNSMSELKTNVPGFPDQFKKPLSVIPAAYYEPQGF